MPLHDNGLLFVTTSLVIQTYDLEHDSRCERHILGDPGAVSRVDKMFVAKVYCKVELGTIAVKRVKLQIKRVTNGNLANTCLSAVIFLSGGRPEEIML